MKEVSTVFDKLTRRIENVTGLKANTSKYEAEQMLVSYSMIHMFSPLTLYDKLFQNANDFHYHFKNLLNSVVIMESEASIKRIWTKAMKRH